MTKPSTGMDFQRAAFVESLYSSLRKEASKAIEDRQKFIVLADSYVKDGLEEHECVELLMIDGLNREAAESYTAMALTNEEGSENALPEYTFQFEENGKILSSYDIGKIIKASSEKDAWEKAQLVLDEEKYDSEINLLLVSKV